MSAAALVTVQVVTIVQTLVLARLLSPVEVGLFAAGTVLTMFLATFAEGALTQALIQRGDDGLDDAADTVFWATIATGALMSLAALAAAPLVGAVFGDAVAGAVAAVSAGTMIMHSFTNVPDALMQRRFDFRRRLIIDPATSLTFAVVAVVFAASGFGVWSLVIGSYAQMAVWVTASWALAGWRPGKGRPSLRLWREMARFAFPMLLGSVVERVRDIAELVLVGRVLDTAALGQYRYGRRIAVLPGALVVQAGGFVLFPAFSRISNDPRRLKAAFLRAITWIWFAAVPVAGLLVASGEAIAVLLLGERWRGAGIALTAMAGFGLGQALSAVTAEAIKGSGRSRRLNWMTAVGLVSGLGLLLPLVRFGLFGVGLAMSGAALSVGVVGLWLVRGVVGVTAGELTRRLLPPTVAGVLAVGVVTVAERLWLHADQHPTATGLALVVGEAIVLGVVYVGALRLIAPDMGQEVMRMAHRVVHRG
ncbi:oligosaccharide flippase family protein [Pseudonocardia sp. GCM10023141]|uniref:oligosaccharide flippase family protein n=1 Tax=Pseudonocardia sp. GCM10023141 TaxID=3252653 RepID=UPI0036100FFF